MQSHLLKYESDPKIYSFNINSDPHSEYLGELRVFEMFQLNQEYDRFGDGLGDYQVVVESKIEQKDHLWESFNQISVVARELDLAWTYGCGHPLTKRHFIFQASIVDIDSTQGIVRGWRGNYGELLDEINRGKRHVSFRFNRMDFSSLPSFPLAGVLKIRSAILEADETTTILLNLHYSAHMANDVLSMCFFLSKCLELVRAILPGRRDEEKEDYLQDSAKNELQMSLHDLFDLANNRFQTRHIIDKEGEFHPRLTSDELVAFRYDADLVIRSVLAERLEVDVVVPRRQDI